ncbi:helix-turn-helix transcriptional regulator [Streptomyces thermospinosisporus]|uniref:helix-turn-helix domain-containing protein n=1 Tax=Streptomyces thermospinosisporus TaxID=161482 RepID=UPI0031DE9B04
MRKVRRLTQRELADLSHVSYSTLTKVEQGVMPASPSVIGALARALSVPVSELNGRGLDPGRCHLVHRPAHPAPARAGHALREGLL